MSQLPEFKQLFAWSLDAVYLNINGLRITQGGSDAFLSLAIVDPEIVKTQVGQDGTVYPSKSSDKRLRLDVNLMQNSRDAGRLWQLLQAQRNAPAAVGILPLAVVVNEITTGTGTQGSGFFTTIPDTLEMNNEPTAVQFGILLPYGLDGLRISPLVI